MTFTHTVRPDQIRYCRHQSRRSSEHHERRSVPDPAAQAPPLRRPAGQYRDPLGHPDEVQRRGPPGAASGADHGAGLPAGLGAVRADPLPQVHFIAVLGVVSVFLTGGIGLLQLDPQWLAVKEAAVPGVIGLAVLFSTRTRFPLIRTLLYNEKVLNVKRIDERLKERGVSEVFEQ